MIAGDGHLGMFSVLDSIGARRAARRPDYRNLPTLTLTRRNHRASLAAATPMALAAADDAALAEAEAEAVAAEDRAATAAAESAAASKAAGSAAEEVP